MSARRNPNQDSLDAPDYLIVSEGKHSSLTNTPRKELYPSRKCFPVLKYGVSGDAPSEFHLSHSKMASLLSKSVLVKDPAMDQNPDKKVLTKDLIQEWPVQSIQTYDLNQSRLSQKFETRVLKPKVLYNCINHQKKIVQRPELVVGEETLYTKRFYDVLSDNKPFNRKIGYFAEFSRRHKVNNTELKINSSDLQGHSRYSSKPVVLTNVHTKNQLSARLPHDHSILIQSIKARSRQSPSHSERAEKTLEVKQENTFCTSTNPNPKPKLPPLEKLSQTQEPAGPTPSPTKQPTDFYLIYARKGSLNENLNSSQVSDFDSLKVPPKALRGKRAGSIQPTRTDLLDKYESCLGHKSIISILNDNKFSLRQDILRYKTKDVAQIVSDRREKTIKGDPEVYIQHKPSSDHERYSNIEVSVLEGTRKYAKRHSGDPARYLSAPHQRESDQVYSVADNIRKFERHIDGLKRSSAQFGHQRWFYNKSWKLGLLEALENSNIAQTQTIK